MAVLTQDDVLAALAKPEIHGGQCVTRIETHAAVVFLAADRALKVKKAVRFPFLDYSTLERRKSACEAELAINRLFAPRLYRRVVPICEAPGGGIEIGGAGPVVEWAVEMNRFDEHSTLDKLAERNQLNEALAERLADTILLGHDKAPVAEDESWIAKFKIYIQQNHQELCSASFKSQEVQELTGKSVERHRNALPLLRRRAQEGFGRRCHGDLHLGNIALIDGAPVLFDAIEFDPAIATGDVLYDLAFLLMDLVERRQCPIANIVLNRYLSRAGKISHYEALAALPLFLSLRAAIRAKVTAARARSASAPQERAAARDRARDYFQLARTFLAPPKPALIAVGGLSGTGKSLLARMLAPGIGPAPGAVVLRSDVIRKRLSGVAEAERLAADRYAPHVTKLVYETLASTAFSAVAAGHSVIADAVYADEHERLQIARVAGDTGIPFVGI
ncbi:MAG TPA: AAA family ATPase, partial [Nitrospira sp.]|nr:AAA family ATPase [Nitrospira sp.]